MARIELRDADVILQDGFSGSAAVDDLSIAEDDTTLEIDTVADLSNDDTIVPVGARFQVTGHTTVYTVTAQDANEVQTVTLTNVTGGHFKLTFDGQVTVNIHHNAPAATVQAALNALSNIEVGDVVVTGGPGPDTPWVVEFQGQYLNTGVAEMTITDVDLTGEGKTCAVVTTHPGGTTWELTFTPMIPAGDIPADADVITFLPQQLTIKIGDGNITYTEHNEYSYDLDRGDLDTVREGNQVPMDVKLDAVFEHITQGTSEAISPMDALKGIGGASAWVSASADQCEPYCIDLIVKHTPPCGTSQLETVTFPDFRSESREINYKDATISVSGKCKATEPTVTRTDA